MLSQRLVETTVGLFLLAVLAALLGLAFKVSGLTGFFQPKGYRVTAAFDDIGQLKVRSAIKISGVTVGEVTDIQLDPVTFKAIVGMRINAQTDAIPDDSSAAILTAGLLGDNYIAITPMYSTTFLRNGGQIEDTHSAMILEKLIGQFLFKASGNNSSKPAATENNTTTKGAHP